MPFGPANADTDAALRYHDQTSHTEARLRRDPHHLDWANQPLPFKVYRDVESVRLPADPALLSGTTAPALDAIAVAPAEGAGPPRNVVPDLGTLTRLLYLSAGITKRKRLPGGGEMYFRAYPNTGALYHVDVYLVCGDVPGLPAGVYHFGPEDFSLHRLRKGDHRARLVRATGENPRVARAPVVLATHSGVIRR